MLLALLLAATPWAAPAPVADQACAAAACTTAGEVKVCKCVPAGEGTEPGLVVEGPGERHLEWDARAHLGEVADFLVASADLDGDGAAELLVANRSGESNGLAVRTWELAIVDGASAAVTHALAHDFGLDALGPKGTLLLTEWVVTEGKAVFTGREYRYAAGRLEPTKEPVRRRALDAAFELERHAALGAADRTMPARAFLAHASTKKGDDALPKKPTTMLVKGLSREEPWLQLHLQRPDGELEVPAGDAPPAPLRLGDTKARRLYPLGYAPADAETWLVGKSVRRGDGEVWVN
jgi:hypothetical protein